MEKRKGLFIAIMELLKSYNKENQLIMWKVLEESKDGSETEVHNIFMTLKF